MATKIMVATLTWLMRVINYKTLATALIARLFFTKLWMKILTILKNNYKFIEEIKLKLL